MSRDPSQIKEIGVLVFRAGIGNPTRVTVTHAPTGISRSSVKFSESDARNEAFAKLKRAVERA